MNYIMLSFVIALVAVLTIGWKPIYVKSSASLLSIISFTAFSVSLMTEKSVRQPFLAPSLSNMSYSDPARKFPDPHPSVLVRAFMSIAVSSAAHTIHIRALFFLSYKKRFFASFVSAYSPTYNALTISISAIVMTASCVTVCDKRSNYQNCHYNLTKTYMEWNLLLGQPGLSVLLCANDVLSLSRFLRLLFNHI